MSKMQQHYVKKTVQSSNVVFLKKTVSGANTFGLHMELPLGMLPLNICYTIMIC